MLPNALYTIGERYILYDMSRQVLERDLKRLNSLKFPELYEPYINILLQHVSRELRDIKKDMLRHQFRVSFHQIDPKLGTVQYNAVWKGNNHLIRFSTSALRNRTKTLLLSITSTEYTKK